MTISVCIVEDHKRLRESLVQLIESSDGFTVCGVFPNANTIVKNLRNLLPDVLLLDIQMPGINGIDALVLIRKEFPDLKVLLQTVFEDEDKIFSAICAGASGYILKNTSPQKYLEAIQEVYAGGAPIAGNVASKVLAMFRDQNQASAVTLYNLSDREKEILDCLVKGLSYKMIADKCSISYDTVRFHMKNIYAKLHVSSMTEAVAKAIRDKLT
jgi:DNA-binding NarL/FixJ family response regulator